LAADIAGLGDRLAEFAGLVGGAPERGTDRHSSDLAAGVLERVRLPGNLIFLGEARIEDPAEIHVASVAAGPNDDAFARAKVQRAIIIHDGDAQNASGAGP